MEYCASCGKPCGRSHRASVQSLSGPTRYLCDKCAEESCRSQIFVFKYMILPIGLIVAACVGIRKLVCEWIPTLCGSNFSAGTLANIQTGTSLALSILLALLALKIMLKPWKRLKTIGRIALLIVVVPVVLVIFAVIFAVGWSGSGSSRSYVSQPQGVQEPPPLVEQEQSPAN